MSDETSTNHRLARQIAEDPRLTALGKIASAVMVVLLSALVIGSFSLQGDVRAFMATVTEQVASIQKAMEQGSARMDRIEDRVYGSVAP